MIARKKLKISQKGDTILEVLIAVAVLSLVLTTAFALANRSTQANRQANERGEASKIAQAEMEKLKLFVSTAGTSDLPAEGQYFCMNDDATDFIVLGDSSDGPADVDSDPNFISKIYQEASKDNQCRTGVDNLYYEMIQRGTSANGNPNTYSSTVRWPAVTGNGVDRVNVVHRIYPDQTLAISAPGPACVVNNNIAVALDNSGSMDESFSGGLTKMQAAKALLNDFYSRSEIKANGNQASLSWWNGNRGGVIRSATVQPMTSQYTLLNSALQAITTMNNTGTNIKLGLDIANTQLVNSRIGDPNANLVLILITDGAQSGDLDSLDIVEQRATEIKLSGVTIYAIGIFPGGGNQNAENFLRNRVASTGGFTSADNATELENTLEGISNTLDC